MTISRRTFLAAGAMGALALATAGWLKGPHAPASGIARRALDADAEAIFAAIASVMLDGALPAEPEARAEALGETMAAIDTAVQGLPASAQSELAQLLTLLALPPVRVAFARIGASWQRATPADVRAFVDRLRASSWTLPRAAYDALHQIIFAAWYGNPRAWAAIGYGGPPPLAARG